MKRNWFWWFERTGWFVAGFLGFFTYRLIDHWSAFVMWGLVASLVTSLKATPAPRESFSAFKKRMQQEKQEKQEKNWFWWFERTGWLVTGLLAGFLGFFTYRLIDHWSAFAMWGLVAALVIALKTTPAPRESFSAFKKRIQQEKQEKKT